MIVENTEILEEDISPIDDSGYHDSSQKFEENG